MVKFNSSNENKPLYNQLMELLKSKIDAGLSEGTILPTERELSQQYGVSRTTVRIALQNLENQGYVERIQGKGTFVSHPEHHNYSNHIDYMFFEQIIPSEKKTSSRIVNIENVNANEEQAEMLEISSNKRMIKVTKLYFINDEPVMLEEIFLIASIFEGITVNSLDNKILAKVLLKDYNQKICKMNDTISVTFANINQSFMLDIQENSPLLGIDRVFYNQNKEAVGILEVYSIPEKFNFVITH